MCMSGVVLRTLGGGSLACGSVFVRVDWGGPWAVPVSPPQAGMSPWAAGGLGAVGGGLLGYELGRMAGEHEQQAQEGDLLNPDQTATFDQGSYDPGIADSIGAFDAGGFSYFCGGDIGGGGG